MACAPHYCTSHNTGTTTCSGHRAACAANRPIAWWDGDLNGETADAANVDELRVNIRAEVLAYNAHATYNIGLTEAGAYTTATVQAASQHNNLANMVTGMTGTGNTPQASPEIITDIEWDALITNYNVARQNCICNTDCSCNAVCACHGDCGCNYSDERLKKNIEYC